MELHFDAIIVTSNMKLMSIILCYFRFCALCCYSKSKIYEYFLIFWALVHIGLLVGISVVVIINFKSVFYVDDAIGAITDILQLAVPIFSHFAIIIESISKRSLGVDVWRKFKEIENSLCTFNPNIYQRKERAVRNYFIKIVSTQAICLFLEIFIISNINNNLEWRNHWYASLFSFVVTRSEHFFFTLTVDRMRYAMHLINSELTNIRSSHKFRHLIVFKGDSRHRRLVTLKKCYNRLWEISCLVEKCFGWSQFLNISSNFLCLTVNLYWNFVAIYFQSNPNWKESLMGTCPPLITIFILLNSCERCLQEVCIAINFSFEQCHLDGSLKIGEEHWLQLTQRWTRYQSLWNERGGKTDFSFLIERKCRLGKAFVFRCSSFQCKFFLNRYASQYWGSFTWILTFWNRYICGTVTFDGQMLHNVLLFQIIAAIATYLMIFIQFMPKTDIWYVYTWITKLYRLISL